MKTKDVIIDEYNEKINEFVKKYSLFCGGCCFAAYALAKNLTELGIKYKVVIFQYNKILNVNTFNDAFNGKGVAHVAIQVTHRRKSFYIGDCSGIMDYFKATQEKYKIKKYTDITPQMILNGYNHYSFWNWEYNTDHNPLLLQEIRDITNKHFREYVNEL